jgi:hypothetical protein
MRFLFYMFFIVFNIFSVLSQNELMPRIIQIQNKYGLVDEKGNSILLPIYDTIYSSIPNYERISETVTQLAPVFIFKKNAKYSFAYYIGLDTVSNFKILPEKERYWRIGELIYDSICKYSFDSDYYSDTTGGFGRKPYYVFKFKSNNKWGMLYIRGVGAYLRRGFATPYNDNPGYLGQLEVVNPVFDEIVGMIGYSLYEVKLNGKWTFLQVLCKPANYGAHEKWNKDHTAFKWELAPLIWCERTFNDKFDTIVPLGGRFDENQYFNVKKDNKWGAVKLNDKGELNYTIPCIYDTIAKEYTPMIAYTDTSTVLYDYDGSGKSIELKLIKDKDYKSFHWSFTFKNFHLFLFTSKFEYPACTNSGTGEITSKQAYNIILIDTTKNKIINEFLSTRDVFYKHYYAEGYIKPHNGNKQILSMLISKKVKSGDSFTEYFIDVESGEVKFSVDLSKNGKADCLWYFEWGYSDQYLPIINYKKRKNGKRKEKYIGYYDFKTKEYKKGRCRGCR